MVTYSSSHALICSLFLHDAVNAWQVLRSEQLLPLLRDPDVLPRLAPYLVRISKTPLSFRALWVAFVAGSEGLVSLMQRIFRYSATFLCCVLHCQSQGAMSSKTTHAALQRASCFAA